MRRRRGAMGARRAAHRRRTVGIAIAVAAVAMLVPAFALAHIERASYWPDPAPDTSVKPAAGGSVPAVRSIFSALKKKKPGKTRVVCQTVPSKKLRKHGTAEAALEEQVDEGAEQGPEDGAEEGLQAARVPAARSRSRRRRQRSSARLQHQAAAAVQVQVDPGCGHRLAQQRPGRDHAGPLHRAQVAGQADQRPGLRPVQDHQRQEPGRRGLLRLPVALPERPEPDRGPRPVS